MGLRTCIYCLNSYEFPNAEQGVWTKEHVLQQAFGKFMGDVSTLVGRVCGSCNQDFGDTIDRILTRSSEEALNRFRFGKKKLEKIHELGRDYFELAFDCPGDEVWHKVRVEFYNAGGILKERLTNQYAFRDRQSHDWVYFSEDEFHHQDPRLSHPSLDLHGPAWKTISRNPPGNDRLLRRAYYKGVYLEPVDITAPPGDRPILSTYSIDQPHQRAIAKIAFNYLAKVSESKAPNLVLDGSFDKIRSFIVDGTNPGWQMVQLAKSAMLHSETETQRLTNGHLTSVECKTVGNNVFWLAQITIYNHIVFEVFMTKNFGGMYYPIHSCHHWNIEDYTCKELKGLNRNLSLIGPVLSALGHPRMNL